ncbi:hypothetical protein [Ilumatobacter sp.]|uniref:hypothetical protein n=1 Tax=Ilumatobacter sp. TaxID=1967498 RepID=UPI003B51B7C2
MVEINFTRGLDVYALVDSDSDEARAFTTYLGYWDCLARAVEAEFGSDPIPQLVSDVASRSAFQKLQNRAFAGSSEVLKGLLLNGWNSEQNLYLVDPDDPRASIQTQWINVFAYYSSGRAALAWLLVQNGSAPTSHRALLKSLAALTRSSLIPAPWDRRCESHRPLNFSGFTATPTEVSNLASDVDCYDLVAKMLKTTRGKRIDDLLTEQKRRRSVGRARNGERAAIDHRTEPTTVFDFMYRSRARANYGDPSMFYMGHLTDARSAAYLTAVRSVTNATMGLFELLIAQRAGDLLLDAATHWMARDRSGISDRVLKARLRTIGVVG